MQPTGMKNHYVRLIKKLSKAADAARARVSRYSHKRRRALEKMARDIILSTQ